MGKDFSYAIIKNGALEGFTHFDISKLDYEDFTSIYDGMLCAGRNSWDGPSSRDRGFTKEQMIKALQEYVGNPTNLSSYNSKFTLRAFAEIIAEMSENDLVVISYD